MKLLSLDVSTTAIGWALMEDGVIKESGCLESNSSVTLKRLFELEQKFSYLLIKLCFTNQEWHKKILGYTKKGKPKVKEIPLKRAVIEDGFYSRHYGSATPICLGKARYLVERQLYLAEIPMEYLKPQTWKSRALGKPNVTKEDTLAYFGGGSFDEADAIGLAYGYWNGMEVE